MTKGKGKKGNRFGYMGDQLPQTEVTAEAQETTTPETAGPVMTSVARRKGRMEQDREQMNVRLPTALKRRAVASAVLAGLTIGELIEKLLIEHLERVERD